MVVKFEMKSQDFSIINGSASHSLSTLCFTANTNAQTFNKANKDAVEEAYSKCEY